MSPTTLKLIHVICVAMTFVSISLRGYWMIINSPLLRHKLTRILPHVIDTMLLVSGFYLVVVVYGEFYRHSWLLVKLVAVVVYIVLGSVAIRYGKTRVIRITALILAWCVFFYIAMLARNNSIVSMSSIGI